MQIVGVDKLGVLVDTGVSPRHKQGEGEVDGLKRCLNGLSDDADKRLGKLEQFGLDSVLDSVVDAAGLTNTLKQWTRKTTTSVIYDSTVDEFTDECFFQAVRGKPNVAIIATTTDGDVFGGFYSVAVTGHDIVFDDPNLFVFSFESNGRCMTPQRFVVKEEWRRRDETCVEFYTNEEYGQFVWFGAFHDCGFFLGNEKSITYCIDLSCGFEGIKDTTLSGKNCGEFTCWRLDAIQLE